MILFLAGCATTPWGTWAFTLNVTEPSADDCTTTVTHNFTGAHVPESTAVDDEDWSTEDSAESSPVLFFGRIEEVGQGSMLIVGSEALPGTYNDDGSWTFAWEGATSGSDSQSHASGYDYGHTFEKTSTLRVKGSFNNETFTGTYATEATDRNKWEESDTWSDEAAAYAGDNGDAPAGSYLVLTDGAGVEYPANNSRGAYDCDAADCSLQVEGACGYSYEISGQLTSFEGNESAWTEDAGQPTGL